ncbi:MAG: hypothetical protein AAGJ81_09715 [Verrucomicrobiota bacterium]
MKSFASPTHIGNASGDTPVASSGPNSKANPSSDATRGTSLPIFALILSAAAAFLSGCAGYQKGALPNPEPATIYLKPVQNEAYVSGMVPVFQNQLSRTIAQSRYLIPVQSEDEADMVAYVQLVDFRERPIAFLETDTGQAISARISLSASVTLDHSGPPEKEVLKDKVLTADAAVYSDPDTAFANPTDQSKPTVARNLAMMVTLELELNRPPPEETPSSISQSR